MSEQGKAVRYIGASDAQVNWGGNRDPRKLLSVGCIYHVRSTEVHSWHTKLELEEFPGQKFNSVSFEAVENRGKERCKCGHLESDHINGVCTKVVRWQWPWSASDSLPRYCGCNSFSLAVEGWPYRAFPSVGDEEKLSQRRETTIRETDKQIATAKELQERQRQDREELSRHILDDFEFCDSDIRTMRQVERALHWRQETAKLATACGDFLETAVNALLGTGQGEAPTGAESEPPATPAMVACLGHCAGCNHPVSRHSFAGCLEKKCPCLFTDTQLLLLNKKKEREGEGARRAD